MRTTLVLDDRLVREAKKLAADRKTTVSEIVNQALRDSLARPQPPARPFKLITYGGPGKGEALSVDDIHALLDEDDLEQFR